MAENTHLELDVMGEIATSMKRLTDDTEAKRRVLQWAMSIFLPGEARGIVQVSSPPLPMLEATREARAPRSFDSVADLYAAVSPSRDSDRALVVGYWLQVLKGTADLDGYVINKELKHLGVGVSNITNALTALMERRPQLVIQTRKSGSTQQARKLYRLTDAGVKAVERMLADEENRQ